MQRKKMWMWVWLSVICAFIVFNWVCYNHAWRMTHFVQTGERTRSPETLSLAEKLPLLFFGITVPRPQNDQTPADYGLFYEVETLKDGDDGHHYLEGWWVPAPSDSDLGTIIMFHGYAVAKSSLLTETVALHNMGYNVFLVDFRGSGGSYGNQTTVGYEEKEDVVWSYRRVKTKTESSPIVLYGVSMGGAAVMRAVATTDIEPDAIIVEAVFDEMLTTVQNRFNAMGVPSFPAANLLVFWGSVQNEFSGFEHNPADYAEQIDLPVLMLHGANDPRATLAEGQHIFNQLAAEQKEMVVFDGAKHESTLGVDPEKWEQAIKLFLEELE